MARVSPIVFVSGVFALSLGFRVAASTETVLADGHSDPPAAGSELQSCNEPEMARLLDDILARERRLKDSEATATERAKVLEEAEARVNASLAQLTAAQERLRAEVDAVKAGGDEDITKLTAVYETMKAKDAAVLFAAMDPEFAAGFLSRMRPDAAAAIIAGLSPERGYAISVVIAGRRNPEVIDAGLAAAEAAAGEKAAAEPPPAEPPPAEPLPAPEPAPAAAPKTEDHSE